MSTISATCTRLGTCCTVQLSTVWTWIHYRSKTTGLVLIDCRTLPLLALVLQYYSTRYRTIVLVMSSEYLYWYIQIHMPSGFGMVLACGTSSAKVLMWSPHSYFQQWVTTWFAHLNRQNFMFCFSKANHMLNVVCLIANNGELLFTTSLLEQHCYSTLDYARLGKKSYIRAEENLDGRRLCRCNWFNFQGKNLLCDFDMFSWCSFVVRLLVHIFRFYPRTSGRWNDEATRGRN